MQKLFVMFVVLIALPLMGWSVSSREATQETKPLVAQRSPEQKIAEGELSRVDSRNQLLWIKSANGKEMEFSYTDQTKVEGSGGSIEGLAGMSGTFLKIQYESQGGKNVAVDIRVQPKQG